MKQRFLLLAALLAVVAVLIILNVLTYVQQEQIADTEARPNRSTFNAGATGTRALHDLLKTSGKQVVRWQTPVTREFEAYEPDKIDTFVIVGSVRREITEEEAGHLLAWVTAGGQLILIDRNPDADLLRSSAPWEIGIGEGKGSLSTSERDYLIFSVDPADPAQMTDRTAAVRPAQPTVFTAEVNGVQPSKFATSIRISRAAAGPEDEGAEAGAEETEPAEEGSAGEDLAALAPVIHFSNRDRNLVADFPLGAGRIVLVTDPFIVANGGISLADNAQAAVNLFTSRTGPVAFDEYHQGFGADRNRLISYFSGTPVLAILLQGAALAALVLFSRGRRFARPLPLKQPDRLSKLEYVSAMAQLQGRTRAFDLAIENIYTDFRRRVARYFGVDNFTVEKRQIAKLISERTGTSASEVADLMERCEDVMHGGRARKAEVLRIVRRLREIEDQLGLKRGKR